MTSKSKNKGNSGERELCAYFSELFGGSFTRVPNSGAMIGGQNVFRKAQLSAMQNRIFLGDIIPSEHMQNLVVESKFYHSINFHQLLQSKGCLQLNTWIEQCTDVIEDNHFWIICFKINMLGWWIVIPEKFIDCFMFENYADYTCKHGRFFVTELKPFCENNVDAFLALSA